MPPRAKYLEIAELLRHRIECGDYGLSALPGAPKLAAETGVSYLTARQAVRKLIEDGVVRRAANGRLEVEQAKRSGCKAAYVYPVDTPAHNVWRSAILQASEACGCVTREIPYGHHSDPLLYDALDGDFDLIFLQFTTVTPLLLEKIRRNKDRVVTLFYDLTEFGVRCFDGPDPASIYLLMKHLHDLGHRRIDCFFRRESDGHNARIDVWRDSLDRLGCDGTLHDGASSQRLPIDMEQSYYDTCRILERGEFKASAAFCLTASAALGVIRAFHDHGVRVPEDVSVASFGDRVLARMVIPSITVICPLEPQLTAAEIFEHFTKKREQPEKLMFRTMGAEAIQYGESTMKAGNTKGARL